MKIKNKKSGGACLLRNDSHRTGKRFAASLLVILTLSMAVTPAISSSKSQPELFANNVANPSFETGDFTAWITQDITNPLYSLSVVGPGAQSSGSFFVSYPTDGNYAAFHGWGGDGPGNISIVQDITLPSGQNVLEYDFRVAWDLTSSAVLNRSFSVNIEPAGGGPPLQTSQIITAVAGTSNFDTGNTTQTLDLTPFAGSSIRTNFTWNIPDNNTDPAQFQLDNIYVGQSDYRMDLAPGTNLSYGFEGTNVDYNLNVNNRGTLNDTYNLTYVNTVLPWPITFRDIGDTKNITNISVLAGTSAQFIARVTIPLGVASGDFDMANISATSQNDTSVWLNVSITTVVPINPPWLDDFEFGMFGGNTGINWTSNNPALSGVSTDTSNSGSYSMYTHGGAIVTSWAVNMSSVSKGEVRFWIRRGADAFSENPGNGQDLELYYKNVTGYWTLLDTFLGGGIPGENYISTYSLPADALHSTFQLRFFQTAGNPTGDFWHIDDVYIGQQPVYRVNVTPPTNTSYGMPGTNVDYIVMVNNSGMNNDTFDINYSNTLLPWPVTFRDNGDTQDITNISVLAGTTEQFIVRVAVNPLAISTDFEITNISVTSQNNSLVSDNSTITTGVPFVPSWLDDFEYGIFGGSSSINWTANDPALTGINSQTSQSGLFSMYTHGGVVVSSHAVDMSAVSNGEVRFWVRRGADAFSENPGNGQDLELYYKNVTGNWILLDTFLGNGLPGEIYTPSYILPIDALHTTFQLRFFQTAGAPAQDFWHVDDVYIGNQTSASPPIITGTNPIDGTAGILVSQNVVITFNKSMNISSVTYTIEPAVTGIVNSWTGGDTILTVAHNAFAYDTKYWVNITGAKDVAGNYLNPLPYSFSFTTITAPITVETATATGPISGPTNNASINITYTWAGTPMEVWLYYTTDGGANWTFAGNDTTVDGDFNWTIPADGVYGWIAQAFGGSSSEPVPPTNGTAPEIESYVYDSTSPTITSTAPIDAAFNIQITATISIIFSESIPAPAFTYSMEPNPNGLAEQWNTDNTEITINHNDFAYGTKYWLNITGARDMAGNDLSPLPYSFYFDTQADTTYPLVDAGIDITANSEFTQDATASDVGSGIAIYLWTMTSGPGSITFGTSNNEDTTISASTDGTYVIRLRVTDNSGNSAFDEFTLIWDTQAPSAGISPTGPDIPVDTEIIVTFNETVNKTLAEDAFSVSPSINGSIVWEGTIMSFVPDGPLNYDTEYAVIINSSKVMDRAGNAMNEDIRETFVTSVAVGTGGFPNTGAFLDYWWIIIIFIIIFFLIIVLAKRRSKKEIESENEDSAASSANKSTASKLENLHQTEGNHRSPPKPS